MRFKLWKYLCSLWRKIFHLKSGCVSFGHLECLQAYACKVLRQFWDRVICETRRYVTLPDATPPLVKIYPFTKMAITFEPVMQFWCQFNWFIPYLLLLHMHNILFIQFEFLLGQFFPLKLRKLWTYHTRTPERRHKKNSSANVWA